MKEADRTQILSSLFPFKQMFLATVAEFDGFEKTVDFFG